MRCEVLSIWVTVLVEEGDECCAEQVPGTVLGSLYCPPSSSNSSSGGR